MNVQTSDLGKRHLANVAFEWLCADVNSLVDPTITASREAFVASAAFVRLFTGVDLQMSGLSKRLFAYVTFIRLIADMEALMEF